MTAVFLFIVYSITRPFGAAAQAGFGIGSASFRPGSCPSLRSVFPLHQSQDRTSVRSRRNE